MSNSEILKTLRDEIIRQKRGRVELSESAKVGKATIAMVLGGDSMTIRLDAASRIAECLGLELIVRKKEK